MWQNKLQVESTFKSYDTEEFLDKIFYRPLGYVFALSSKQMGISPNTVTIISIIFGVAAGHLFFYQNMTLNIIGICFLIFAETLDSTDGQLARMTNFKSRFGRILDGFGGNIMFFSIYIHICIRVVIAGETSWIFLVAVLAGFSHSLQSAVADYSRNLYLYIIFDKNKSELDKLNELYPVYNKFLWKNNFVKKFLMRVYINYTKEQEIFLQKTKNLFYFVQENFAYGIPEKIKEEYKALNKPMLKYHNILTTNTRMIALFILIFINKPEYYFLFELFVLNGLLVYVIFRQEAISRSLLELIK
ncbi:MAG: CDP-alcohol phosphatidyltransferase family protein [Ignavibacteriaceae bacterium]|jgi:phosphatidylglycerophosphate synthase